MVRCLAFPVVALLLFAAAPSSASAQDAAGAAQSAAAPRPGPQVNINAATAEQLEELPGVGPKMAARIVEYRQKNGGFKKVEELPETSSSVPYSSRTPRVGDHESVSRSR